MRSALIAVTAAIFFFLLTAGSAAAQGFGYADVAAEAYLIERGAIEAGAAGRQGDRISRAEALSLLLLVQPKFKERTGWRAARMPPLPLFVDVSQNDWFAPYIETAFEAGIVTGYPDRTFRPSDPIAMGEVAALLARAYGRGHAWQEDDGVDWYAQAWQESVARNVVPRASLLPDATLSRGEMMTMVYRMDVVERERLVAFASPLNPSETGESPAYAAAPIDASVSAVPISSKSFAITIPKLGINDLTITHPLDPLTSKGLLEPLKDGVGHLFGYPGNGAKIMIYGHSSGYPWDVSQYTKIFRTVNQLSPGDRVYVTFEGSLYEYEVARSETIDAKDTAPFSGQGEDLILYTCWPPDSIKQRYLVHALPVHKIAEK